MKVVIRMFQGSWEMSSGVIHVPEETGHEFRMMIPTPVKCPVGPWRDTYLAKPPESMMVMCVFLYTGERTSSGTKIYHLNDIRGVSRDGV